MLTIPTQNEITHKGSEIVHAKIKKSSKAAILNHLKFQPVYFSYSHWHLRNWNQRQNKYTILNFKPLEHFNNCDQNKIISKTIS